MHLFGKMKHVVNWKSCPLIFMLMFATGLNAHDHGVPSDKFDLSEWNITIPTDDNNDGKPDSISVKKIQDYSHPDFFYLSENGEMVFT